MIPHIFGVVRNDKHRTITTFMKKFYFASFMKTRITNSTDLVYKIAIKFYDHGNGECKTSTHPLGIGSNWLLEIKAKFSKIGDEIDVFPKILFVNPAYKPNVVQASERSLKSTAKCKRPRHRHGSGNITGRRLFCTADKSNQR